MSELSQVNYQEMVFHPGLPYASRREGKPVLAAPPKKLPLKDSIFAFGFLTFYLTAYLAVGFAGIKAVGWAWSVIFG
jgi:hypothetical protein